MLQARFNLITGDRLQWGDLITFVEDQVRRPAVESLHGSLGMFLAADKERGAAMLQSFWTSRAARCEAETWSRRLAMLWLDVRQERLPSNATGSRFSKGRRG
ncbi:MAG TPA: hypothetical protein VF060_23575 [Trebonia sp.]